MTGRPPKRFKVGDAELTIREIAELAGCSYQAIYDRIQRQGMSPIEAMTTRRRKTYPFKGERLIAAQLAVLAGCETSAMWHRLERSKMTPEDAVRAGASLAKSFTVDGVTGSIPQLIRKLGLDIDAALVRDRMQKGHSIEVALYRPKYLVHLSSPRTAKGSRRPRKKPEGEAVGLDRGVREHNLVTDSSGRHWPNPMFGAMAERKLRKLHAAAEASNSASDWNAYKAALKQVDDRRTRHLETIAKHYADRELVVLENLIGIRHRDAQIAAVDAGWEELRSLLEAWCYEVIVVDPKYTSTTCSRCRITSPSGARSGVLFRCPKCGFEDDADVNAARNILARGCGDWTDVVMNESDRPERGNRYAYQGRQVSVAELAKLAGCKHQAMWERLRKHSADRAVKLGADARDAVRGGRPARTYNYRGANLTLAELATRAGCSENTMKARLHRQKRSPEEAVGMGPPTREPRRKATKSHRYKGQFHSVSELARIADCGVETMRSRLGRMTPAKAVAMGSGRE